MKLVSIDIETTGLDPQRCQTIEVGAVIFDPQPELVKDGQVNEAERRPVTFECLIRHPYTVGDAYALQMNQEILAELAGVKETHRQILLPSQFSQTFSAWLNDNIGDGKIHPCGKNYAGFDAQFLRRLPGWDAFVGPYLHHRVLDPGSLYFNPEDGGILNLDKCLDKIGVSGLVTHRALDDALAVMTSITRFFN